MTSVLGTDRPRTLIPGLGFVAVCAALAFGVNRWREVISALVVAVVLGALAANLGIIPSMCRPGLAFASRKLLRIGVVLLGFRLTFSQIRELGPKGLSLVVVVVTITFFGTQWLGRRLGLSPALSLLVATGFSICGASAVAAMRGVTPEADDEDVAYAIALVTLCGSLAIFILPAIGRVMGFRDATLGSWIGASVHDVAQTIATAAQGGADTKTTAIVVKLTRVVLLAPLVLGVSVWRRRGQSAAVASAATVKRPPLLPLFVIGFLCAIAIRSTGWLSSRVTADIKSVETLLFAAALVGLGAGVDIAKLRRIGGRPLALGLSSWALIALISAIGVQLLGL
jgi:uncharacterized integral membrane protein (TIGR00698 family)